MVIEQCAFVANEHELKLWLQENLLKVRPMFKCATSIFATSVILWSFTEHKHKPIF